MKMLKTTDIMHGINKVNKPLKRIGKQSGIKTLINKIKLR